MCTTIRRRRRGRGAFACPVLATSCDDDACSLVKVTQRNERIDEIFCAFLPSSAYLFSFPPRWKSVTRIINVKFVFFSFFFFFEIRDFKLS